LVVENSSLSADVILLLGGTSLATAKPATGVAHKRKSNSVVERWAMPAAGSFLGSKDVTYKF
jgi:hypothetical protein